MRNTACVLIALLLAACTPPTEGDQGGFHRIAGDDSASGDDGWGDPGQDQASGGDEGSQQNGGDDGGGDVDPGTDGTNVDGWDATEPDVPDGTRATFYLECGFLAGPGYKTWEKDGNRWVEVWVDEGLDATAPRPELTPCFSDGGKSLEWYTDGEMYIAAGGMDHDLWPTATPDRWLGDARPMGEPSEACLQALESVGLSLPVTLSLELVSID